MNNPTDTAILAAPNTFEVSALTDAALDLYLDNGMNLEGVTVEHLTDADRRFLAVAYGWDLTAPFVCYWIANA